MADTITNLINSPPGQLVAGGVLAGIVWKFFERVEGVLKDETKKEIAVWLLEVKPLSATFQSWPDTFAKVFDRMFGTKHVSWNCFFRSCAASLCVIALVLVIGYSGLRRDLWLQTLVELLVAIPFACILPDYVALLSTRIILSQMRRTASGVVWILWLGVDSLFTLWVAQIAANLFLPLSFVGFDLYWHRGFQESWGEVLRIPGEILSADPLSAIVRLIDPITAGSALIDASRLFLFPALFTSTWLVLFAGSGFLLKAARRFDLAFQWFNRRFDIEHKPLSSIGLVLTCINQSKRIWAWTGGRRPWSIQMARLSDCRP